MMNGVRMQGFDTGMKDGRVILPSYERDGASVTNQTARQPCEGMDMTNCVWNEMLTV